LYRYILETKTGRCGEWANAFTLCCRALGYEARWVMDWTDHVWTECWSQAQARWLHCDSCEDTCDKPLLYEQGWGKKLSYVVAFGKDGVVDVSRRYTMDAANNATRRGECDEAWLKGATAKLTARLRAGEGDPRRRRMLEARDAEEQLELEQLPGGSAGGGAAAASQEHLPGRQTGSLAWRAARGELGADPAAEAAAAAAASPWAAAPTSDASAAGSAIPGVKPLPDDFVVTAATRVATSASADKLDILRRVLGNIVKVGLCKLNPVGTHSLKKRPVSTP
jgi:peptide-N4-(N-acetyl-beta-glucosaminyl)asparagine amidase